VVLRRRLWFLAKGMSLLAIGVGNTHTVLGIYEDGRLTRHWRIERRLRAAYAAGELGWADVRISLQAWNAHAAHGTTWRLRRSVFDQGEFRRQRNDVADRGVGALSAPTWGPPDGGVPR
jgi:hypothetical protein